MDENEQFELVVLISLLDECDDELYDEFLSYTTHEAMVIADEKVGEVELSSETTEKFRKYVAWRAAELVNKAAGVVFH